jgi:hypothetical protein
VGGLIGNCIVRVNGLEALGLSQYLIYHGFKRVASEFQKLTIIAQIQLYKIDIPPSTDYYSSFITNMDHHVGTTFDSIIEAKTAIKAFVANAAESWKLLTLIKRDLLSE